MNRRLAVLFCVACVALPFGCKKEKRRAGPTVSFTDTSPSAPASTIPMGMAAFEHQLLRGFHQIEANSWRWTARSFAVSLLLPARADRKGAVLEVSLTVPPVVIAKVGTITLTASVAGHALPAQSFNSPGLYVYRRDVEPELLTVNSVQVEFQLDKAIPPNNIDQRELGIIVSTIALSAK